MTFLFFFFTYIRVSKNPLNPSNQIDLLKGKIILIIIYSIFKNSKLHLNKQVVSQLNHPLVIEK